MSSYSASRVTITLEGRILQQINASGCTFFDLTKPVIGSVDLSGYAEALRSVDMVADLQAGWATLSATPGALNALEQAAPVELAAFTSLQANSMDGFAGAPDFQMAANYLSAAIDTTVHLLRSDERELTASALQDALTELGYTVTPGEGEHVNSIAAYKADHVIAALVADGGITEIDTAGLTGDSCAEPLTRLDEALRARGIDLHIERRVDHGDSNGGTLIQKAATVNAENLADGLIATVEGGQRTPAKSTIRRRRFEIVGGAA